MSLILLDSFCLLLIVLGAGILFGRPADSPRTVRSGEDPRTYIRRIAGVMLMVFGLALGLMATVYHFAVAA